MLINTQQPIDPGTLARLYANGSPDVGSQVGGWLNDQGHALGIGDPTNYFAGQRQDAYNASAAQQGQQVDLAKLAGTFQTPEMRRNALIDAASATAAQGQQQQQLAGLQQVDRLYPLPAAGAPVSLHPLDQQEATRLGQSPEAYTLNRRLRAAGVSSQLVPDLTTVGGQGNTISKVGQAGGISAEDLYNEPSFQAAMRRAPDKAHAAFQALTGSPLLGAGGFHDAYQGRRAAEIKQGTGDLHQLLMSGHARPTKDGVEFAETQFNPVTSKMEPTGKFTAGDPYQRSLGRYLPNVSSSIAEFQRLAANRDSSPITGLQDPDLENAANVSAGGVWQDIKNYFSGGYHDYGRIATWNPLSKSMEGGYNPAAASDFYAPTGNAGQHIAPLMRNPKFQELLHKDPASAQRIISAMRAGRSVDQSPLASPAPQQFPMIGGY